MSEHVLFSKRHKIAQEADKWISEADAKLNGLGVKSTTFNIVTALNALGYLKETAGGDARETSQDNVEAERKI